MSDRKTATTFFDTPPPVPEDTDEGLDSGVEGEELQDLSEAETEATPLVLRQALAVLVTRGVLLRDARPAYFQGLVEHEEAARVFFRQIFMELVINPSTGLAIIQPEETDAEHSSLVRPRSLSLYDSIVLVQLRKYYQERLLAGEEQIIIEIEQIENLIAPLLPAVASESLDRSKLKGALARFLEHKLITRVRGREETYELTAVIQHVVNADMLDALLGKYQQLAGSRDIALDHDGVNRDVSAGEEG